MSIEELVQDTSKAFVMVWRFEETSTRLFSAELDRLHIQDRPKLRLNHDEYLNSIIDSKKDTGSSQPRIFIHQIVV